MAAFYMERPGAWGVPFYEILEATLHWSSVLPRAVGELCPLPFALLSVCSHHEKWVFVVCCFFFGGNAVVLMHAFSCSLVQLLWDGWLELTSLIGLCRRHTCCGTGTCWLALVSPSMAASCSTWWDFFFFSLNLTLSKHFVGLSTSHSP